MATCLQTVPWTSLNSLPSIRGECRQRGKQVVPVALEQNWGTGCQSTKPETHFQNGQRWFFHLPDMKGGPGPLGHLILGDLLGGSPASVHAVCEARTGQVVP